MFKDIICGRMDNWSWLNAYKNRYGFIAVDLDDDAKRTIKKSGRWFKEMTANNGFRKRIVSVIK